MMGIAAFVGLAAIGSTDDVPVYDLSSAKIPSAPVSGFVNGSPFSPTETSIRLEGHNKVRVEGFEEDAVRNYCLEFQEERAGHRTRMVTVRFRLDFDQKPDGRILSWRPHKDGTADDQKQKGLGPGKWLARGIHKVGVSTFPLGGGYAETAAFRENISARIEFGKRGTEHLQGKIILSWPDGKKSAIAGTFKARFGRLSF